jgi:hypothetical protein
VVAVVFERLAQTCLAIVGQESGTGGVDINNERTPT